MAESLSGPWTMRRVESATRSEDRVPGELFADGVVFEEANPANVSLADIDPAERTVVANAIEYRQRQFAAGRLCARRALARLGIAPEPLVPDQHGMPRWPRNVVGSISHVEDKCGAAVALRGGIAGVGFDIERALDLPRDTWRIILTENEQSMLCAFPENDRGVIGRLVFSAKEAFYKCYRSVGGGWLDFEEVELRATPGSDTIEVWLRKELSVDAREFEGRYALTPRFVYTAFIAR